MIIPYASRTGTRRNLDALREAGWRLMLSPTGVLRTEGFPSYALDNGAWTAYNSGTPWDRERFIRAAVAVGAGADFIVAPDIVAGAEASLLLTLEYLDWLAEIGLALIPVQDGMVPADVEDLVRPDRVGIFVGGSTEWKLAAISVWGPWCAARGVWCHVGRVNSVRRIRMCINAGCTSFDGSGVSRYSVLVPPLTQASGQLSLLAGWNRGGLGFVPWEPDRCPSCGEESSLRLDPTTGQLDCVGCGASLEEIPGEEEGATEVVVADVADRWESGSGFAPWG